MNNLEMIIPHTPSENMAETIGFMSDVFGFEAASHTDFYSGLRLDDKALGVLTSQGEPHQQSIYLKVSDVDALWANIEHKIKKAKPKPPFNQAYGMREFHVVIPATNTLLFVGSELANTES